MCEVSAAGFRELGYTVCTLHPAEPRWKSFVSHPQMTVLFTDIVMPNMNGRDRCIG